MNRIILSALILGLLAGCQEKTEVNEPVGKQNATDEMTVEDARSYVQSQIDRYLGGQRTQEQFNKIKLGTLKYVDREIESIEIKKVLPAFTEEGEESPNHWKVMLVITGDNWVENEEADVFYNETSKQWNSL